MAEKEDTSVSRGSSKSLQGKAADCDLYSLDRYQLKNLIDKNIRFIFFQIEDFSCDYDKSTQFLLMKAKRKAEEDLLSDLQSQEPKQPVVLICDKGGLSQKLSKKLRDNGFINVYFVKGGLKSLLENSSL